jgi:CubicO group peptidase (beta-lactamase class C family)
MDTDPRCCADRSSQSRDRGPTDRRSTRIETGNARRLERLSGLVPPIAAICLALGGITHKALAAASPASDLDARIDKFVAQEMQRQQIPGVAVAVVRGNDLLVAKGYGEANLELRAPVSRETIFQSGSIGKQFTAVAVMMEVEAGRLALDQSVTSYFKDAPSTWRPITVRHLLTHTSGLPSYSSQDIEQRRDYSEDEFLKAVYGLPLEFEPGTRWSYSNSGYAVLGFLIHKVSGRFYGDILHDRVFVPLGMKSARIISEEDIVPNRAAGYRLVGGQIKNQEWIAPTLNTTADGSLYLCIDDYLAWDRGLRAHALLTPASWAEIYRPAVLKSGRTVPYGFGWSVEESRGHPWWHHNGGAQGFATSISRYLADDLTIVVLTNLAEADPSRFVDGVSQLIDPALAKLEPNSAIPDRHPDVTGRVRGLLASAGAGTLSSPRSSNGQLRCCARWGRCTVSICSSSSNLVTTRSIGTGRRTDSSTCWSRSDSHRLGRSRRSKSIDARQVRESLRV